MVKWNWGEKHRETAKGERNVRRKRENPRTREAVGKTGWEKK